MRKQDLMFRQIRQRNHDPRIRPHLHLVVRSADRNLERSMTVARPSTVFAFAVGGSSRDNRRRNHRSAEAQPPVPSHTRSRTPLGAGSITIGGRTGFSVLASPAAASSSSISAGRDTPILESSAPSAIATASPAPLRPGRRIRIRLRPPVAPVPHRLIPELRVLRLQHPVPFIRKVKHLARHIQPLQRRKQLKPLRHIQPIVPLRMNHQRRRLRILDRQHRRPLPERILRRRLVEVVPRLRRHQLQHSASPHVPSSQPSSPARGTPTR